MFKTKNQKPKTTRYEHIQFRAKLKQARTHKRVVHSLARQRLVGAFRLVIRFWKVLLLVLLILGLGFLVVFYKPLLFVTQVDVVGMDSSLNSEVKQDIANYLTTKHWLLPQANILLLSETGLSEYILDHNKLVWKVEKVERKYPHRLVVTVAARAETFVFGGQNNQVVYIANDGTVMDTAQAEPGVLSIMWPGEHLVAPGSQFLAGALLDTLLSIRNNFVSATGLETLGSVEIVPLRVHTTEITNKTVPTGEDALAAELLSKTMELVDVPPQEVRVHVEANAKTTTPAFYIMLDVGKNTSETLGNLKLLLGAQAPERLSNLFYIDMRFGNKAFICLRAAPCATQSNITTTPLQ